jgi:hypothetical protein
MCKANGGSAGIDSETIENFEQRLSDNLYKLWNRLCSGSRNQEERACSESQRFPIA